MLTQEEINQFKEIYLKEFGNEINDQTAILLGNNLLNLMQAVYKPIPKNVVPKNTRNKNDYKK